MNGATRPIDPAELLANAGNLRALARRLVADDHDADDVVQQTFVAAVERPPRADVPLRPWLARVARNFALRTLRGRRRRAALEAVATPRDAPASPAESVARTEMLRELVDAVLALEPVYRDVVIARFLDELDMPDVAARLGVPIETARTRLKRALSMLRDRLDRKYGDRRAWALLLVGRRRTPTAATAAGVLGGALMAKKLVAAGVLVVLLFGGWYATRSDERVSPKSVAGRSTLEAAAAANRRQRAKSGVAETEAPPMPTSDVATPATVAGVVVDGDGAPVADAEVYVVDAAIRVSPRGGDRTARTGAAGRFELTAPTRAPFDVIARKAHTKPACAKDVTSPPTTPLRLVLEPGERITGRVTDMEGRPVEGALVRALGPAADPDFADPAVVTGRRSVDTSWDLARTNSDGRYALGGLATGETHTVEVRKTGMYPDYDTSLARSVVSGATGVDFVLGVVHAVRLTFVDARTDEPVPSFGMSYLASGVELTGGSLTREWYVVGPNVSLDRRRGIANVEARIKRSNPESSRPRIHLTASAPGYAAESIDVDLTPTSSARTVRLVPTAAGFGDVELRLRTAAGRPVADCRLDLLVSDEQDHRFEFFGLRVRQGDVRLDHVPTGRLHVELCDAPGMTVPVSDFLGTFDAFDVDVAPGGVATRAIDVRPSVDRMVLIVDVADDLAQPLAYADVAVRGPS